MTDAGQTPSAGPSVCPFVALAEDRDRRADAPDERSRCYAEKAPRRRDMVYQSDYCYSRQFASCSVFLAWAARNAAEPAYVTEAARRAWASGIALPGEPDDSGVAPARPGAGAETRADVDGDARAVVAGDAGDALSMGSAEEGFFGPPDPEQETTRAGTESFHWVSASAWAEAPWDPRAEAEADELEAVSADAPEEEAELLEEEAASDEALQGPKVPAALPMRRRRPPQQPIRARGSGEWHFADPLGREPLVSRRRSAGPPILLAVLGLLIVSIIVLLLPALLGGIDADQSAALASPSPGASARVRATPAPVQTAQPSSSPSPIPEPQIRVYVVKPGDTLSGIATKSSVAVSVRLLQCINGLTNPNLLQPGQELLIPPDGYSCPAGWRRASPAP